MEMILSKIIKHVNGCLEETMTYRLGYYIMKHYHEIMETDFDSLVNKGYFTKDEILDFCRQLGANSFESFQARLLADEQMRLDQINARMMHIDVEPFYRFLETTYAKDEFAELIDSLTDLIETKKRIIIIGALYPSSVAVDFQMDLITLGKTVIAYPAFDEHFMFCEDDLVFVLTATGRTLENFVRRKKDKNICATDIVLVTQNIRYRGYEHVCADYVVHVLGKFDGIQFNYQLMMILDLLRIRYYQKYY